MIHDDASSPPSPHADHGLRRRERVLRALYDTAGDLSSLHDVDEVLTAIVGRARRLLETDAAYLMLIDPARRLSTMRVADGVTTPGFLDIELAHGVGLAGLIAESGIPQWTASYAEDPRFSERIAPIVAAEGLEAILGAPLRLRDRVIGVLLVAERTSRSYDPDEVDALASLAHHAAIALNSARLISSTEEALQEARTQQLRVETRNDALTRAADLHRRLTTLVASGASVSVLADAVAQSVGGRVHVLDEHGAALTSQEDGTEIDLAGNPGADGSHAFVLDADPGGSRVTVVPARAGTDLLGFLAHEGRGLDGAGVLSLEQAAVATALLLVNDRAGRQARASVMSRWVQTLLDDAPSAERRVRRAAAAAGVALADRGWVAIAVLHPAKASGEVDAAVAVAAVAERRGGLASLQGWGAALLVPVPDLRDATVEQHVRSTWQALSEALRHDVTVGSAGPCLGLAEAARAMTRAHECALALRLLGRTATAGLPSEVGEHVLLLSGLDQQRLHAYVHEVLGPLLADERGHDLATTLHAHVASSLQVSRTARALHVHPNTVYKRLERAADLLGADALEGDRALPVHLAVGLWSALDPGGRTPTELPQT